MQASQCGNQMSTKIQKAVYNENCIGGGEYCVHNGTQLGHINVLYPEAPGGNCVPRAVLMGYRRRMFEP
jgi:hypothetical protein